MFDSIRLRLTLGYVSILAAILVLFGVVVVAVFRDASVRRHDDNLVRQAETLADVVSRGESVDTQGMNDSDEYAWAHLGPDGRVLDRDTTAEILGLPFAKDAETAVREGGTAVASRQGPEGGVRVASVPVLDESGRKVGGTVQIGRSLRADREALDRLVWVLVPIGLGALLLAGFGGLLMSRRALRPARNAFERQRAFVADASHELKTPLSLAKIDAEVLLRDPHAPDARKILEHQLSEIDRTNALLSDLLFLARLDAGKLDVARDPFNMAIVLVETSDRFRARAADAGVDLDVQVPAEQLSARGDADRTSQILAALLDNALRFTPEGGSITVAGNQRNDRIEVTVTDTGPGIASEQLSRVFDRFHRADAGSAARTRGDGGTGLGLAIARDLSRAQDGELTAEGSDGSGGATLKLALAAGRQSRGSSAKKP